VQERLFRLRAQPGNDGDTTEAEDQERVVGVAHDSCEFGFEQPIQDSDDRGLFVVGHRGLRSIGLQ
jgi:hypothetical protein